MTRWRLVVGRFEIDLRWWALAIVMAAAACSLGVWQLHRGAQKVALQDAYYDRMAMEPIGCAAAVREVKPAYVRVRLWGRFLASRQYLLDNRTSKSTAGYEVLTPFRCDDGTLLIVNRGWLAAGESRDVLPDVPAPLMPVRLSGFVYVPTGLPPLIGDNWPQAWVSVRRGPDTATLAHARSLKRIGYLDAARLQREGLPGQQPFPVVVDAHGPGVFEPNYAVESVSPMKHWGYAAQWFAMAVGILGYLGYRSMRRR